MMQCLRITFCMLFLFYCEISFIVKGEEIIQMLRKKVVSLEDSLSMDIAFLRHDIKKNSEEFKRLSNLLDGTLSALSGEPDRVANKHLSSHTKQSDITHEFELANRRLKRAFAEEKAVLRKVTSRMNFEMDHLTNEIKDALGDINVSNVEAKKELGENLESFKTELMKGYSDVMADLGSNMARSVETMSRDIAEQTNKAVSSMQKISHSIEIVPDIKTSVDDIRKETDKVVYFVDKIADTIESVPEIKNTVDEAAQTTNKMAVTVEYMSENINMVPAIKDSVSNTSSNLKELHNAVEPLAHSIEIVPEIKTSVDGISKKTDKIVSLVQEMAGSIESLPKIKNSVDEAAQTTSKVAVTVEYMSENINMVPAIKDSVVNITSHLKELHNAVEPFATKFDDINEVLDQLKMRMDTVIEMQAKIMANVNNEARLVNASTTANTIEGRLEVFVKNEWGTVCDNSFDMRDANVACRMLGFSKPHSFRGGAFYGKGFGPTWMHDVYCESFEYSLFKCFRMCNGMFDPCGSNHHKDVGVRCHY